MPVLKIGDLVWAKMKGFPPWPGLISEPPDELMENAPKKSVQHCIYFFGTHDYGWIDIDKLKPYLIFKNEFSHANKSLKFRTACKEIFEFFKNNDKTSLEGEEKSLATTNIMMNEEKCEYSSIEDDESEEMDASSNSGEEKPSEYSSIEDEESEEMDASSNSGEEKPHELSAMEDDELEKSSEINEQTEENPEVKSSDEYYQQLLTEIGSKTPSIKLNKLDLLPLIKGESHSRKRAMPQTKYNKKRKSNYSDADTTTPLGNVLENQDFQESKDFRQSDSVLNYNSDDEEPTLKVNEEVSNSSDRTIDDDILKVGFIGLGNMGRGIIANLLKAGHYVTIWNRSSDKVGDLESFGAHVASTPGQVVAASDYTFCCVFDSTATKEIMFKPDGVIFELTPEKSYIDITSVDVVSSIDLSEAVYAKGSRYLELRLEGSKKEADEGSLICLAAGDHTLYDDCSFFFKACSRKSFFMGEVGNASKMHLILQLITGVTLAGLAESMALADRAGINQSELLQILEISQINCPLIIGKAKAMHEGEYSTQTSVINLQKDLSYALNLGDSCDQPTPIAATANELLKHSRKLGYGGHDVAAIILGARF